MNNNYDRFISDDLNFENNDLELKINKEKRIVDNYLKNGSIVKLKTNNGTIKIKELWKFYNGKLYDYVGSDINNDSINIYFNNDDIDCVEESSRRL